MLIRIRGGSEGVANYLENGIKQGRELSRDDLDERVILEGDLELADTIIEGMQNHGEHYLHITLAFKEDSVSNETLLGITQDFKNFAMAAYDEEEYNFYAEAHLPKIKSYVDRKTGELIQRKPHIHIVIPKTNLLSGQGLDPFGRVERQVKFLEAFQEHTNAKYGLASPKENRRVEFTDSSEMISRYKGDVFQGHAKELKARILSQVLEQNITDYDRFKTLLAEHGETRIRNAGSEREYLNVKPAGEAKGVNLKDYAFSREFVEKSDAEKRGFLNKENRQQYESPQQERVQEKQYVELLNEWHYIRAAQIKYINGGNRKLYTAFIDADQEGKRAILADRATTFYKKHRPEPPSITINGKELDNERPEYQKLDIERIRNGHRAAILHKSNLDDAGREGPTETIPSMRDLLNSPLVFDEIGTAVLLPGDTGMVMETDRAPDHEMRREGIGPIVNGEKRGVGPRYSADNVIDQQQKEYLELKRIEQGAHLGELKQIKQELDARRLLDHLSKTHGLIPDKYTITQGKDGGDRIKAGTCNLNVSDFLTKEMRLNFSEAAPILREVYAAQLGQAISVERPAPSRELWQAFRLADQAKLKQRASDWKGQRQSEKQRRAEIRNDYQAERRKIHDSKTMRPAERKAALSIARMTRVSKDMVLTETLNTERQALKERYGQRYQVRYQSFLQEQAGTGNEAALGELRRQGNPAPASATLNSIEAGPDVKRRQIEETMPAPIEHSLTYLVDHRGNVTYFADVAKRRALVIDAGRRVEVEASTSSRAVELGLRLSMQKFGSRLAINGSEEFKRKVVEVAVTRGLKIQFSDEALNVQARELAERIKAGQEFIERDKQRTEQPKPTLTGKSPEPAGVDPEAMSPGAPKQPQPVVEEEVQKQKPENEIDPPRLKRPRV